MTDSHTKMRYSRLPAQQSVRVFEAAARHLSFTLAADELAMTQSGVSKQIKGLETFLETPLFIRQGQSIRLTSAGKLFHKRSEQALNCLQQVVQEIQGEKYLLRLQAPPTFASRWLIPRMEKLQQDLPKLDLRIETTWLRRVGDKVKLENNALAIHACINYPYEGLDAELLRRESLFLMVSPDYMAKHGQINQPQDLAGHTLIHTRIDGHIHWEAWAKHMQLSNVDTTKGYEFETLDMAISAAENGIGVIICDLVYALESIKNGRLVIPFNMPLMKGLRYFLLNHPNNYPSDSQSSQRDYRSWLKQQIALDQGRMEATLKELGLDCANCLDAL